VIDRITQARLADGVSNASVNRLLQCIRVILRRAVHDWEWLDRAPKIRFLHEPKRRVRWLTRDEAERLIAELAGYVDRVSGARGLRLVAGTAVTLGDNLGTATRNEKGLLDGSL
jgi:hypothetical protein